jgi:DNA helicase HerA-like ATPase
MVALFCSPEAASRELEADILKRALMAAKEAYLGERPAQYPITVDTPVPFRLSTMLQYIDKGMGQISKPSDTLPYLRLKSRIETLRADRRFEFMFGGVAVQDTMSEILSKLLRIPVAGQPITIVDLSAVPVEVVDSVVSLLCRLVFDFSVWTTEEQQVPILLVCEEAHRYIPSDDAEGFAPTRKALSRIAKEGRKYGVALGLVTQRPSELSETILSQCGTLFALRMSNDRDQEFVRRALPDGARALFNALPALGTREAIVVGEGTAVPMRIRFARLSPGDQPRAGTMSFAAAWQKDDPGPEILDDVIDRWRRQLREHQDDESPRIAVR